MFGAASGAARFLVAGAIRRLGRRRVWAVSQGAMGAGVLVPAIWPGIVAVGVAVLLADSTSW